MRAADVRDSLATIFDPCSIAAGRPVDIVSMGLVDNVRIDHGSVEITLRLTEPSCMYRVWFIRQVRSRIGPNARVTFAADLLWPTIGKEAL